MHAHGIQARCITRNSRLLRVYVPFFNIVFLDSLLYLNGSLSSLTKAFGLETVKGVNKMLIFDSGRIRTCARFRVMVQITIALTARPRCLL